MQQKSCVVQLIFVPLCSVVQVLHWLMRRKETMKMTSRHQSLLQECGWHIPTENLPGRYSFNITTPSARILGQLLFPFRLRNKGILPGESFLQKNRCSKNNKRFQGWSESSVQNGLARVSQNPRKHSCLEKNFFVSAFCWLVSFSQWTNLHLVFPNFIPCFLRMF